MGFVFYFSSGFTFFLREIKDNAYAVFFGGGGKGQTRFIMGDKQMTNYALQ